MNYFQSGLGIKSVKPLEDWMPDSSPSTFPLQLFKLVCNCFHWASLNTLWVQLLFSNYYFCNKKEVKQIKNELNQHYLFQLINLSINQLSRNGRDYPGFNLIKINVQCFCNLRVRKFIIFSGKSGQWEESNFL